jgi:hypothetical protein
MSKGNTRRSNKEAKKPKQEKPRVIATANNRNPIEAIQNGKKTK